MYFNNGECFVTEHCKLLVAQALFQLLINFLMNVMGKKKLWAAYNDLLKLNHSNPAIVSHWLTT